MHWIDRHNSPKLARVSTQRTLARIGQAIHGTSSPKTRRSPVTFKRRTDRTYPSVGSVLPIVTSTHVQRRCHAAQNKPARRSALRRPDFLRRGFPGKKFHANGPESDKVRSEWCKTQRHGTLHVRPRRPASANESYANLRSIDTPPGSSNRIRWPWYCR